MAVNSTAAEISNTAVCGGVHVTGKIGCRVVKAINLEGSLADPIP